MGEWWTSMNMGSGLETHPAQTKSKSRDEAKTDKKIPFTSMTMGSESVSIVYKNSSCNLDAEHRKIGEKGDANQNREKKHGRPTANTPCTTASS
jgi:hypothetical protein